MDTRACWGAGPRKKHWIGVPEILTPTLLHAETGEP